MFRSLLIGLVLAVCSEAHAAKLNVLLIMADDLRPALGCYGDAQAKTPNIDKLASRGVLFDRAYVQYTVCNPSRTSILTGLRCEQTGIVGNATFLRDKLPEVVTLPELFRNNGWRAESYGKILHAGLVEGVIEYGMLDVGRSWDVAKMFQPTEVGRTGDVRNLTGGKLPWCRVGPLNGEDSDQSDSQTATHVISAMERLGNQPWFVGAGFHRPHDPFIAPRNYFEMFPDGSLKLFRDPPEIGAAPPLAVPKGGFLDEFNKWTDRDRMDYLQAYYAGVAFTDANVGRLMQAMDRLTLWDRTIVIFVGDHGYHLGERGWWNKSTLFDRCCRAPMIVCAPGAEPGVAHGITEFVDLYPTLADYCGLTPPHELAGTSLRPQLENPEAPGKEMAFTLVTRGKENGRSVRTDRWRYTLWSDGNDELYDHDHDHDPEEHHSVANDPSHAAMIAGFRERLERIAAETH